MLRKSLDNVNHEDKPARVEVLELIHAVMHKVRAHRHQLLRDDPRGATHMDSKVLAFFARHPGATQSDLAQHSGRDKAQLARLIKGLRAQGLLDAEADAEDRRNLRLRLTDDGRRLQQALRQQARSLERQAIAGLQAQERLQLIALLQHVSRNLDDSTEADEMHPGGCAAARRPRRRRAT